MNANELDLEIARCLREQQIKFAPVDIARIGMNIRSAERSGLEIENMLSFIKGVVYQENLNQEYIHDLNERIKTCTKIIHPEAWGLPETPESRILKLSNQLDSIIAYYQEIIFTLRMQTKELLGEKK